jgi:hypothetical protein
MNEFQLPVSSAERDFLIRFLEDALKETRIEEHRTRTPSYREHIVEREEIIAGLLEKLAQPVAASP